MKTAQIIIVAQLIITLFSSLWQDFHGRTSKEPYGFSGAVITLITILLITYCYYIAGAFSALLP